MKYEHWNIIARDSEVESELVAQGISPLAAMVLAARGVTSILDAKKFLASDFSLLLDPFLMKGMVPAVDRIRLAIERKETIAVYGDYDVDGITSTCLLSKYLASLGANVIPYIPNRLEEGYSLNTNAITKLRLKGVKLLITVDCGITNRKEADFARGIGVDVIITDHHECKEEIPNAIAVINPHQPDCSYPFKQLAGVGVALKLALALTPVDQRNRVMLEYSDLAAIGTVADVMSLTGENRAIVAIGLKSLSHTNRPGLQMLIRESGQENKPIASSSIGFSLAPRINASGRMGCPDTALELLMTSNLTRGEELAQYLCDLNRNRQSIEQSIFNECVTKIEENPDLAQDAIVFASKEWHQGVVGIVASRLCERFSVPSFMICLDEEGHGKGSCRSYADLNLFQTLESCEDLLVGFGGHELAAGFTILEENIDAFRTRIQTLARAWTSQHRVTSSLNVDAVIENPALLTINNVNDLLQLEPFGSGNPQPVFSMNGVTITSIAPVGKGKHTRLKVTKDGVSFDAILFSFAPEDTNLRAGCRADLAFYPQINQFRGSCTVQLLISDWRPQPTLAQLNQQLYQRWKHGDSFTRRELDVLVPDRQDFVAVWRYLSSRAVSDVFIEAPSRFARNVARASGHHESYVRTMICLEVMHERGLIHFTNQTQTIQIRLRKVNGKVDLEASEIMISLRNMQG